MSLMPEYLLIFIVTFAAGLVLTKYSIHLANRLHFYAHPDHRSSHKIPTPRIGGTGFSILMFAFLVSGYLSGLFSGRDKYFYASLFAGGLIAFLFGLRDDIKGMKPGPKLFAQIAAAVIPAMFGIGLLNVDVPFFGVISLGKTMNLISYFLGAFWILSFMNIFNFMDGMNGKAGTYSLISILSIMFVLIINGGGANYLPLLIVMAAGLSAFLFFNITPAKTFMGDCGSQLLGYALAVCALYFNQISKSGFPFVSFFLIFMPFIYDSVYTIILRFRRGEKLSEAHHSHLYQRLLELGFSHNQVLKICIRTYIFCGLGGILYSSQSNWLKTTGILITLITMTKYKNYVIKKEINFTPNQNEENV